MREQSVHVWTSRSLQHALPTERDPFETPVGLWLDNDDHVPRMANLNLLAQATAPGGPSRGEPVDLASGLFVLQKTDLVLPGRLPLALTRTYRTLDSSPGPFGLGTSHPYDVFVTSLSADALLLTLPGNSRALFARRVDMSEESPE